MFKGMTSEGKWFCFPDKKKCARIVRHFKTIRMKSFRKLYNAIYIYFVLTVISSGVSSEK